MELGDLLGLIFGVGGFFMLLLALAMIAGMWKTFEKAGKPGWAAIIPIYNMMIWLEITGRPMWWLAVLVGAIILSIIPIFLLLVYAIFVIMSIDLAKSFGKDVAWGFGIAFLGFIFLPMLGFGNAEYKGPHNIPIPGISGQS